MARPMKWISVQVPVPDDSNMVFALEITEETYDIYLQFPAGAHHPLETVRGAWIVVPVDVPLSWGWMSKEEFLLQYEPMERSDGTRAESLFTAK